MGVSVIKCWVGLVCCCLLLSQLTAAVPAALQDYDAVNEVYDWLADHGLERRGPPSLRLRFGKRDMGWQVAQRSMPSLRLRFGKRTVDQAESLYDREVVRKDTSTPRLRLRFGKRDTTYGQEEDLASHEQ
uniref:Short neuropeptide F n=1 Tax=Nephrops norvegicus TaxID=6829 RepID=A0A4D6BQ27_NEPNO|nr:short neuropeptide F [Nephrops norvegicus]